MLNRLGVIPSPITYRTKFPDIAQFNSPENAHSIFVTYE